MRPSNRGMTSNPKIEKAPDYQFQKTEISRENWQCWHSKSRKYPGFPDIGNRFLKAGGISHQEYQSIKTVLANEQKLPLKQYFDNLVATLKGHGYEFDTTFKKSSVNALYPGLLRCPDVWDKEWRKKAFDAAFTLLQTATRTLPLIAESTNSPSARQIDLSKMPENLKTLLGNLRQKISGSTGCAGARTRQL